MDKTDWYKHGWSLNIKNSSWTEDTERQVEFLIREMGLTGGERVLDLACGYGRHALALARRGFSVVGVDITPCYVEDAIQNAALARLPAEFILSDIRDTAFESEFDMVLNMADGAVGYLETEAENLKIFDVIARALKPGGKHFMDVMSGEYAERHFPCKAWEFGQKALAIAQLDWLPKTRQGLFAGADFPYGEPMRPVELRPGNPTRLYTRAELREIYAARGMEMVKTWSDFAGAPAGEDGMQLMVWARKRDG